MIELAKEYVTGTRDFCPGLCLKTVVQGSYSQLPSVYAKQIEWAKREGYENNNVLYEVYVTNLAEVSQEDELVMEVYYPVRKRISKNCIKVGNNLLFESKEEQLAFNQSTDINGWVIDSTGTHAAGWGLTLTPMDMAKIGQLYLNGGIWEEKQIISLKWVEDSTIEYSRWKKENLSYGYLWWVNEDGYAAMGNGGNVIYVNTKKKLVISIAALFVPKAGDRMELIKNFIEPNL